MERWQKVDLHVHSVLSPCTWPEMTPNNIVNMAAILGLDVIAVCDHLLANNVVSVYNLAGEKGILCIPGVEMQTVEDVHLLCYFNSCEPLLEFCDYTYSLLNHRLRLPPYVGRQLVMDEKDTIIEEIEVFLHQSVPLSLEELWRLTESYGGCCVPAHVDRPAFGLLGQLGFVPAELPLQTVEMTMGAVEKAAPPREFAAVIAGSDAHALEQMVTPGHSRLHPSLNSLSAIWQWLKTPQRPMVKTFVPDL